MNENKTFEPFPTILKLRHALSVVMFPVFSNDPIVLIVLYLLMLCE